MISLIDEFYETEKKWLDWWYDNSHKELDNSKEPDYSVECYIRDMLEHNFDDEKIKAVLSFPNHKVLYDAYLYGFSKNALNILTNKKYDYKQQNILYKMISRRIPDNILTIISNPEYNAEKMNALLYACKQKMPRSAILYMTEKLPYSFQIYGLCDRILSGVTDPEVILFDINEEKQWKFQVITEGIKYKLDVESLKLIDETSSIEEANEMLNILTTYKKEYIKSIAKSGIDLRDLCRYIKFGTNPYLQKAGFAHMPENVICFLSEAIKNGVPDRVLKTFLSKKNITNDLSEDQLHFLIKYLIRQMPKEINPVISRFEEKIKETDDTAERVNALKTGFLYGLTNEQLEKCANVDYDRDQIKQLVLGYGHGLSEKQIALYNDPRLTSSAMNQMRIAIEHNLDDEILNTLKEMAIEQSDCVRQGMVESWKVPIPDVASARRWFEAGKPDIFEGNYKNITFGILEPLSKLNIDEKTLRFIYSKAEKQSMYTYANTITITKDVPLDLIQYLSDNKNNDVKSELLQTLIEACNILPKEDFKKLLNPQLNTCQILSLEDAILSGVTKEQFDFINDPKLKASVMDCIKMGFVCGYSKEHLEFFKIFNQILIEHVPDLETDYEKSLIGNDVRDFIFHVFDGKYEPEALTAYVSDFIKTEQKQEFLKGKDIWERDSILEKYNKYVKNPTSGVGKSVLDKIKNETKAKSTGKKCDKSAEDWSPLYF